MDLSTVTVDFTPVYVLAVNIISALIGLAAVRKAIKLSNRS